MNREQDLEFPIKGTVDTGGRLIAADEDLLQLHRRCGGFEGDSLAVPQLAALCRLSQKLKMPLSRAITAADEDADLNLWVETKPVETGIEIAIVEWIETAGNLISRHHDSGAEMAAETRSWDGKILTDAVLRILSVNIPGDPMASDRLVGKSLLDIFDFSEDIQGLKDISKTLAERQSLDSMIIRLDHGEQDQFLLSAQPLISSIGEYTGYKIALKQAPSQEDEPSLEWLGKTPPVPDEDMLPMLGQSLFDAHLAPAIRKPLGRIIANADTIGTKLEGPLRNDYAGYAKDIAAAGRHLMELVDDLSDLEYVERENFVAAADDIDLVDLAKRVAGLLAVKAADHQIAINTPPEDQTCPAIGEFRRVLQILVNLVGNAIRYSPDGTPIDIEVEQKKNRAIVHVRDHGQGIADDDIGRVFDKFERLGRTGDGGSGLGLFISRRLAEAMGGSLSVTSTLGEGSCFTLSLPGAK